MTFGQGCLLAVFLISVVVLTMTGLELLLEAYLLSKEFNQ